MGWGWFFIMMMVFIIAFFKVLLDNIGFILLIGLAFIALIAIIIWICNSCGY